MGFASDEPSVICGVRVRVFSNLLTQVLKQRTTSRRPPFRKFLRRPGTGGEEEQTLWTAGEQAWSGAGHLPAAEGQGHDFTARVASGKPRGT